jgi:hypothetical protein
VADANGDGKLDVEVSNGYASINSANGSVGVLIGNGDGTLQTALTYDSGGGYPAALTAADVNGDGAPDILLVNSGANNTSLIAAGVLLGNGDGTFRAAVAYPTGGFSAWSAASMAVEDVNGDGKTDLLIANNGDPTIAVLLGNSDGSFQTALSFGSGGNDAYAIVASDLNRDGKPDIAVANYCSDSKCANTSILGVLINASIGPTTTTLTSSLNPSNFGQSVTFTATVVVQGFKVAPTGSVSFLDGTQNIGSSSVNNNGIATLTTSRLNVGTIASRLPTAGIRTSRRAPRPY